MRFLPTELVVNIATLGRLGFIGHAPGTLGSFLGLVWYTVVFHQADLISYFFLIVFSILFAIAFCGEAEIRLRKSDPGEVILDEFVAIPLCFIGLSTRMQIYPVWLIILLGFLLFRFFDIVKPLGIKKLQDYHGGVGVVADDLAAAVATCITLHIFFFAFEKLGWAESLMQLA